MKSALLQHPATGAIAAPAIAEQMDVAGGQLVVTSAHDGTRRFEKRSMPAPVALSSARTPSGTV